MKSKRLRAIPLFILALLLALSCGEQSLTGEKGDQGAQGQQGAPGRSAQEWLETEEGEAWFYGTAIEAWQEWINGPQGKAWLTTPAGQEWLAGTAGQSWQAWMNSPEGKAWLATFNGSQGEKGDKGDPGLSAQEWLATPEGQEWLAKAVGDSWLLKNQTQEWLLSLEGQEWLTRSAIEAWQAYIQSEEGQEWLKSMQPEPDQLLWIDWLAGSEGLKWLESEEGQFWLTGQLSSLSQPNPIAQTMGKQEVFSDVSHIYLIGGWNTEELSMASFSWEKISGPGSPAISNPESPVATVTGLQVGEYDFKFTVTNLQGESDSATAAVSVSKKPTSYGYKEFTANGTFTVPEGVSKIRVSACGGGGGGGVTGHDGFGGGGGAAVYRKIFSVTPGQQFDISIGAGGKGNSYNSNYIHNPDPTLNGGNTTLVLMTYPPNYYLDLKGGFNGNGPPSTIGSSGGDGGGNGGSPPYNAGNGITGSGGHSTITQDSGGTRIFDSGGGGGSLGGGGAGVAGPAFSSNNFRHSQESISSFISPSGLSFKGGPTYWLNDKLYAGDGGFGAGGGGATIGGTNPSSNTLLFSGNGGPGYCLIEWGY